MAVDRTVRCDLCKAVIDKRNAGIGIYWDGDGIVERPVSSVEHHLCNRCVRDLYRLTAGILEDGQSDRATQGGIR